MVVGFNHNFRYKGVLYHVQTEDGGLKNPVIITHLFTGGTILASKKTSYADILKSDRLEQVVEELMKEQHREMLRRLRDGELDQSIDSRQSASAASASRKAAVAPETESFAAKAITPAVANSQADSAALSSARPAPTAPRPDRPTSVAARVAAAAAAKTTVPSSRSTVVLRPVPPPVEKEEAGGEDSLDDVILSYLLGDGVKKP